MKINVLVTAAGSAIGLGIIKSIKSSSLETRIVTTDAQSYAAGLYAGDAAYLVPLAKDPSFVDSIINICKRENIDAVCIGTDYELLALSENQERIKEESGAKVIVSSPDVIRSSNDKWLTHKFLLEKNLPLIPSALSEDADELIEKEGFPLMVKPRIGDSSKNTFIVKSKKELARKVSILKGGKKQNPFLNENPGLIVQKYVGDEKQEYTSSTVVFRQKAYGVISMRREMRFGGHTTKAVVGDFPKINSHIKKVAEKLNPFGPCNFQSRIVDGIPRVFEINCRFSGTTATCAMMGFNSVEACLKKIVLEEEPEKLSFRKGVMLRYFNELIVSEETVQEINKKRRLENPKSKANHSI